MMRSSRNAAPIRMFTLALVLTPAVSPSVAAPPNIVFILVDDLGWMDVGASNPTCFYETPSIDRLASSGTRFTGAYAAAPVCSPTRASILTGKYPARTRTTDYFCGRRWGKLLPAEYACRLALEEVTLAEALKEAGYATFFAGKWHLGEAGFHPEDQGFDVNRGGHERGGP
jgi:arylsulfatase A-like enzyme